MIDQEIEVKEVEEIVEESVELGAPEEEVEVVAENATSEDSSKKELTEVEQEAVTKGWKPDAGPKSAEEFLRSEPLYKEISASHKRIKELKSAVDNLGQHITKQQEIGYQKAVKELESARVEAIRLGDVETVNQLDAEIKEQSNPQEERLQSPEATSFFQRHSTWLQDPSYEAQRMREFAKRRDEELISYNLTPSEHVKIIEQDLHAEFPSQFERVENTAPAAVESPVSAPRSAQTFSVRELDEAQREVYNYLFKTNKKSATAFLKQAGDLKKAGGEA